MLYLRYQPYGQIFSLKIAQDISTKKSRGHAFVAYCNKSDAEKAKNATNHEIIL